MDQNFFEGWPPSYFGVIQLNYQKKGHISDMPLMGYMKMHCAGFVAVFGHTMSRFMIESDGNKET